MDQQTDKRADATAAGTDRPAVVTVDWGAQGPDAPARTHSSAYAAYTVGLHDAHVDGEEHHHHTHSARSHHEHGAHLLQVESLSVSFRMYDADEPFFKARQRDVETIHDLSISVHAGEIVAVVGASGSGKSLLADAILGLFEPNATVTGRIWFDGELCDAARLAQLRGHGISLVPQSVNNLDPLMKVGRQVEGRPHGRADRKRRGQRRRELFARYGLDEGVADLYPFELSGGMARRVLLCCALMDEPRVIVADEPTPGCCATSASATRGSRATRTSSPAASCSAFASRAPWRRIRATWWPTRSRRCSTP